MHLLQEYKKLHYLTFDLDFGVTQNVAQYPLYHATNVAAKFEVAMPTYGLRGDASQENTVFDDSLWVCCPVPLISCYICTC